LIAWPNSRSKFLRLSSSCKADPPYSYYF